MDEALEGLVETDKHKHVISYTQYSMWMNCPLQWKLGYVDKLRPRDKTIHLVFGSAIHETIQEWLKATYQKDSVVDLRSLFLDKLTKHFKESTTLGTDDQPIFVCDRPTIEKFYEHGIKILDYLRENQREIFNTTTTELVGIEVPIDIQLRENLWFVGYLDIVTRDRITGRIKIFDLKTSTKGWTKWQREDDSKIHQLLLYKKFYSKQYNVPLEYITISFVILTRETEHYKTKRVVTFVPNHSNLSIFKVTESFEKFLATCFDEQGNAKVELIKATPSKSACMFCPFNNNAQLCPTSFYLEKQ